MFKIFKIKEIRIISLIFFALLFFNNYLKLLKKVKENKKCIKSSSEEELKKTSNLVNPDYNQDYKNLSDEAYQRKYDK